MLPLDGDGTAEVSPGHATSREMFYEFSSLCKPAKMFRFDLSRPRHHVWFLPQSRFLFPEVETEKTYYKVEGTEIPIRITKRKDVELTGDNPTLLTGYGGFGMAETIRYSNRSALWLAMGGLYVHAGIRGGGEFGREWHQQGVRRNRQRSFDDFIAGAEWLITRQYTVPRRLAIVGGSNSGLLVGAALTQRPDLIRSGRLFGTVTRHAKVPLIRKRLSVGE